MRLVMMNKRLVCRPTLSLSLAPLSNYVQDSTDDDYDRSDDEDVYTPGFTGQPSSSDLHEVGRNQKQTRGIKAMLMIISQGQILDTTTRVLWLYVLEGLAPKLTKRFEWASVVVPPLVTLSSKATRLPIQKMLPGPFPSVLGCLARFSVPAAVLIGAGLVGRLVQWKQSTRQAIRTNGSQTPSSASQSPESRAEIDPAEMVSIAREQKLKLAREYLDVFSPTVLRLKALADWDLLDSVPDMAQRFQSSNCELMRFGAQGGLLEATSEAMVDDCIEVAMSNLNRTANWLQSFEFMNARELRANWGHLVLWTMRLPDGHPVLLVRLGEALNECTGQKGKEFSRALISQINRGVLKLLKDDGIDQLVVVVDCKGARSFQITRYLGLLRKVPAMLNQHYPGRLKSIHFANLPIVLRWAIQAIKPVIHPNTREKFVIHDPAGELPPHLLEALNWGRAADSFAKHEPRSTVSDGQHGRPSPSGKEDIPSESGQVPPKGTEISCQQTGSPSFPPEGGFTAHAPSLLSKNMTHRSLATLMFLIASCLLTVVILNELKRMDLKVGGFWRRTKM